MKNFRWMAAVAIVALVVGSCAKAETEDVTKLEKMAFDAWMQKYVLDRGVDAVEQENGMYVEFIEDGNQMIESSRDTLVWMRMNYTSKDIEGNTFATRDSLEALRQRTYTPYTRYNSEYVYVGRQAYGMIQGRHWALQNDLVKSDGSTVKVSEGSHVRLFIPSYLAYGSTGYSNDQGYGGQFDLNATKIVVEDLQINEVVKNPLSWEEETVVDFARQRWGLGDRDTIATCFFVDTLNFRPRPELLAKFPNKAFEYSDSLGVDSTARIWFVGKFMDGFIFDTNIESVYNEFYNRRAAENYRANERDFDAIEYRASSDQNSYIQALYDAIPNLRRGQWSRIVFTSAYGYGSTGMSKSLQDQQEYYSAYNDYYMQMQMMNSMYGSGYYNNYNSGYYGGYGGYGGMYDYYNYSPSYAAQEESDQQITTEIQPYTPLIFEIYIEAADEIVSPTIVGEWEMTARESSEGAGDVRTVFVFSADGTGSKILGEFTRNTFDWQSDGETITFSNIAHISPPDIFINPRLFVITPWTIASLTNEGMVAEYSIRWDDTPDETIERTDTFKRLK